MTLYVSQVALSTLDDIETSIGPSPRIEFFSLGIVGMPSGDPGNLLALINLPDDWMDDEAAGQKQKAGVWEGEALAIGDIRSFVLKTQGGVNVIAGSVTNIGGGGDIELDVRDVQPGQLVRISSWSFSFASVSEALYAQASITQTGQTMSSLLWAYPETAVVNDEWVHRTAISLAKPLNPSLPTWWEVGPTLGNGWSKAGIDEATGDVYYFLGIASASPRYGVFRWNNGTDSWTLLNSSDPTWWKNFCTTFGENYDVAFDPVRRRFHMTTGGPGWGYPPTLNPMYGDKVYDLATNEFYGWRPGTLVDNPYTPVTTEDTAHFIEANRGKNTLELVPCYEILDDKSYSFSGWNRPYTTITVIDLAVEHVDPAAAARSYITFSSGPTWVKNGAYTAQNSGVHRKEKYLWTIACEPTGVHPQPIHLWIVNLNDRIKKWRKITWSGDIPSWPVTTVDGDWTWAGASSELCEDTNSIVLWVPNNAFVGAVPGTVRVDRTWILDLSTMRWRQGPSAANGDTMPVGDSTCTRGLLYSPQERLVRAWGFDGNKRMNIYDLAPEPTGRGTLTGIPLPAASGSTYGVNYAFFPYLSNGNSKHTNMAYCPLDGRVYVTGGDTMGSSSVEGCWSTDPNSLDGDWRLETGQGSWPDVPVPYDAQDNMGWAWDDASNRGGTGRGKFILWPGSYYTYLAADDPRRAWIYGWWTFDPVTKVWTQYTGLWGTYTSNTGNVFGGAYNPDDDTVYVVGTASAGRTTARWRLSDQTQLPTLTWANSSTWLGGATPTAFYVRSMHVLHNGNIYVLGTLTDGTSAGTTVQMCRYNIATNTASLMSAPPVPAGFYFTGSTLEARMTLSGDKIVWPAHKGPEGDLPHGILIYDINQDYWVRDEQVPEYGNYIGNAVMHGCLPDGTVCFSGGVFGLQQTHFWKYKPAS